MDETVKKALEICGKPDFSTDGVTGWVELTGDFAEAIIKAMNLAPQYEDRFRGYPFKLSRNGGLEIWCNGWYSEGSGVRKLVHNAVEVLQAMHKTLYIL